MALPVTISTTKFPDQNYFCGPFKAPNQAIYVVLLDSTDVDQIEVYKATDPTSSFAIQDAANGPDTASGISVRSFWCYISGSEIHIAEAETTSGGIDMSYHVFDTASDTWTTTNETIENIKNVSQSRSASIAVRSDGDVIVLYNGDTDSDMGQPFERVDYARKEGSTWTFGIDVGGTSPAAENRHGSVLVRGSADNMHFFWTNHEVTNEFQARSLSGTNSLSTTRTSDEMDVLAPIDHSFAPGIFWDDAGTLRIAVPFRDSDTAELKVSRWTESSGAIDAIVGTTLVGGPEDVHELFQTPLACSAIDGDGRMYILWSGGGSLGTDLDLYRDDAAPPYTSWAGETEIIDGTTINFVSCNVYPRDGAIKFALLYDENGTIKYNEVSISAPTAPTMANSRFPDQNYKIGPYSI